MGGKADRPDEARVGCVSSLFILWIGRFLRGASVGSLQEDDYEPLPAGCDASTQAAEFWAIHKPGASATQTVWKMLKADVFKAMGLSFLSSVSKTASVLVVRALSQYVLDGEESFGKGLVYVCALVVLSCVDAVCLPQANLRMSKVTARIANIFAAVAYAKSKRLHPFVKHKYKKGDLVNLALNDAGRIVDATIFIVVGFSAPLLMLFSLVTAVVIMGPVALTIIVWTTLITMLVVAFGKRQGTHVREKMMTQGQRLAMVSEMLQSVKVLKLSAWEEYFADTIGAIRLREERALTYTRAWQAITNPTCVIVTPLSCLSTISIYLAVHGEMPSVPDTFALINILRNISIPLTLFGMVSSTMFTLQASLKRLSLLVDEPEFDQTRVLASSAPPDGLSIAVTDGSFAWTKDSITLKNVSLSVPPGHLVFIVGQLGQGKSSLLQAILGEMVTSDDTSVCPPCAVDAEGGVAYAPQQPFVLNTTVRDNVLFNREFDSELFSASLGAAALGPDLDLLPAGEMTEIGEKGVTLSGGQRARVGLARLAYANPKVAFLDDPFAALDMETGRHVFEHLVCGSLAGATRLVVSSQVHLLDDPRVDRIIVVDGGCIVENGTYAKLSQPGTELHKLLQFATASSAEQQRTDAPKQAEPAVKALVGPNHAMARKSTRVTLDERKEEGSIKLATVWTYIRFTGVRKSLFSLLLIWTYNWGEYAPDLWISAWQEDFAGKSDAFYLGLWVVIIFVGLLFMFASRVNATFVTARAATTIHEAVLLSILQCPLSFFEQTPSGRILNRFGQDQMQLDFFLGAYIEACFMICFKCLNSFVVVLVSMPWVGIAIVILLVPLAYFAKCLRPAMRDAQRFSLITKSRPFSIMDESLTGLHVIRAAGVEDRFTEAFHHAMDKSMSWIYTKSVVTCWGEQRVMILMAIFVGVTGTVLVLMREDVVASVASIGLVYVVILGEAARFFFTVTTQSEAALASVERAEEFMQAPKEAARTTAADADAIPEHGADVVFKNVELRYQPHLDLALHGVSFTVNAGERVGIVGRSGAGKSTILVALVRLVEPCAGQISIGPFDARQVGLRFLRTLVTVIPQDPMVFSGPLRKNLDPVGRCTDEELKSVCISSGLAQMRPSFDLDEVVKEGGSNFSPGERQLLCMARALLRRNPVMLFDEATASVDVENDARLQRVLREEFKRATILTIAHRLDTIIDYDRIMTMSAGRVAEFDKPSLLLQQGGMFASLAKEAGVSLGDGINLGDADVGTASI